MIDFHELGPQEGLGSTEAQKKLEQEALEKTQSMFRVLHTTRGQTYLYDKDYDLWISKI